MGQLKSLLAQAQVVALVECRRKLKATHAIVEALNVSQRFAFLVAYDARNFGGFSELIYRRKSNFTRQTHHHIAALGEKPHHIIAQNNGYGSAYALGVAVYGVRNIEQTIVAIQLLGQRKTNFRRALGIGGGA